VGISPDGAAGTGLPHIASFSDAMDAATTKCEGEGPCGPLALSGVGRKQAMLRIWRRAAALQRSKAEATYTACWRLGAARTRGALGEQGWNRRMGCGALSLSVLPGACREFATLDTRRHYVGSIHVGEGLSEMQCLSEAWCCRLKRNATGGRRGNVIG
jgi:hypothetical protein